VDVFVQGVSGDAVLNYDCSNCDLISLAVISWWKAALFGPKILGWTGQFVFLSWDKTGVDTVYYDPVLAMSTDSTAGMILSCYPTLFLSFLSVLVVHYFFTNNH